MIRIYGSRCDSLPSVEEMRNQIGEQWAAVWSARHPSHGGPVALASLGGLYLLRRMGAEGTLQYTENGRPFLTDHRGDFSITHTQEMVFCALSEDDGSVGLDAEDLGRVSNFKVETIASRWFCECERAHFAEDPSTKRFLSLWTRKEAFVKRSGEGMRQIRAIDTYAPCSERKTVFRAYWAGNTCVTICADAEACVAEEIFWI